MNTILGELGKLDKFKNLLAEIENKTSPLAITGLNGVGMVEIISSINQFSKKPILLVTYNEIQAKKIYEDIKYFQDKVVFFPKKEIVTYDYIAESKELPYKRIEALNKIVSKKNRIEALNKIVSKKNLVIVTTIEALMQKLPKKETLYKNELKFKVGNTYNLEKIKKKLVELRICKARFNRRKRSF